MGADAFSSWSKRGESTWIVPLLRGNNMQFRETILSSRREVYRRSGLTVCAIRGAFLLTARQASYLPAMSARTVSKKWTSLPKAATSAGTTWKLLIVIHQGA